MRRRVATLLLAAVIALSGGLGSVEQAAAKQKHTTQVKSHGKKVRR